ncbi:hypothetical protein Ais01nite_45120 [Asanoa ishikariensis]|uniref:VWFA domain-containing protein n=1 Tax=Asanoa ishikariensis TaxID=137265 RepID=A0A1H3S5H5_9ACTN|nr:VWA domain-containing protein [Asanoa ishikariensis]GIF66477.1 hypothetical protein Ais01nite_45120 [Asanoa ishikariensis]SDZ33040.1 hypothetical protein SAMN05421684_4569 [Asanoa ishikariensis]
MPDSSTVDLATVVARFGALLHDSGVAVGPDRSERFARAVLLTRPATTRALYWCAAATLLADPADRPAFDRAFDLVFGGMVDDASNRGGEGGSTSSSSNVPPRPGRADGGQPGIGDRSPGSPPSANGTRSPYPVIATATERLGGRDFAKLSPSELAELAVAMRRLRLATPPRRSRRTVVGRRGPSVDLRESLRAARRTGGHPVRLSRRRPRTKPRRLVVLCDISGSMAPYARALLQLVYCAAEGQRAEVFTFATRLTRLTRVLHRVPPAVALERAGRAAPDWSGGTRIGAALRTFIDEHGARGMARGAVVLILSDGWDTGEAAELERQMIRLSRLAYRVVWANPRTQSAKFRPLTGGMAAAWPHCDAVVSAHRLDALDELLAALAAGNRTDHSDSWGR